MYAQFPGSISSLGVSLQSQEAYELAASGKLLRPTGPEDTEAPLLYALKCLDFKRPHAILGAHSPASASFDDYELLSSHFSLQVAAMTSSECSHVPVPSPSSVELRVVYRVFCVCARRGARGERVVRVPAAAGGLRGHASAHDGSADALAAPALRPLHRRRALAARAARAPLARRPPPQRAPLHCALRGARARRRASRRRIHAHSAHAPQVNLTSTTCSGA